MFAGDIAMIGNGPWMAASYRNPNKTEPGFEEKIGYAPMPGNFVYGFADTMGHGAMTAPNGEEKQLGAMLFWGTELQPQIMEKAAIELGWFIEAYDYPEDVLAQQPIIAEMFSWIQSWDSKALPWFYDTWTNAVMSDGMTRNMDLYVQGELTLDEYCAKVEEFAEAVGKE